MRKHEKQDEGTLTGMALTFIHTSDWHLGRTYRRIGPRAADTSRWRVESVQRSFDLAVREKAAFILAAGDIFDTEAPRPEVVEDAISLFRDAPVPLVVIPGNHDPCAPGSVWHRREFRSRIEVLTNVRVILQPERIEMGDVDVFATPAESRTRPDDATAWMPAGPRGGDRYRIGLAHGQWQRYNGKVYFENIIDESRADCCGLDYLALGDFHSYTLAEYGSAQCRTYYSGTIECTAVNDERPGHALVVTIDAPGDEPRVRPEFVGHMRPHSVGTVHLSRDLGIGPLESCVNEIPAPERTLIGGKVVGVLSDGQMQEFERWFGGLNDRFLGIELDRTGLYSEPDANDFAALALERSEQRILDLLLAGTFPLDGGEPMPPLVVQAFADGNTRRETISLYYRLLQEPRV